MPILKFPTTIICLLAASTLFGQIPKHVFNEDTQEEISSKDFLGNNQSIQKCIGDYHFGESEDEWDLIFLFNNDSLIIQAWYGNWGKSIFDGSDTWFRYCKTFNEVKVTGNKFSFGKYNGSFVNYHGQDYNSKNAVLIFGDPPHNILYRKDSAEAGFSYSSVDTFFMSQKYYPLSLKVQDDKYFKNRSKEELKIMRNEIYAKYGLIFQKDGEMEKYFRKQSWYSPFQKDVSNCLTNIEKANIKTILRFEQ